MSANEPESAPKPQQVGKFLDSSVDLILNRSPNQVIKDERWGDKRITALLHLISPGGVADGMLGYHVAYTAVDLVERTNHKGIVIANPRISAGIYGVHDSNTTARHYKIADELPYIVRQDIVRGEVVDEMRLWGIVSTRNPMDVQVDPSEPTPVSQFKEDILDVFVSTPVRPETVIPFAI